MSAAETGPSVVLPQSANTESSGSRTARLFDFGLLQGVALSGRDYVCFAFVTLIALIPRTIYLISVSRSPLFDQPILDGEAHDQWARMILEGVSAFPGSAYFKAPLYPYFLALIRLVTGDLYWAPRIVQIVMGSLSCGFVYLAGREAFNRTVGLVAGLASAFYWVMIYFDAELLLEPLSIFLMLVSLWIILRAAKRDSLWLWAVAGLFMGLSAITRPNVLIFIPVIALWLVWAGWPNVVRSIWKSAVWCFACAIPILPVTIRNYVVGHDFVLIASQAGPNFFIGNNPTSDGYSATLPGARSSWLGGFIDWRSMAEQRLGRKLKASEVDQFFFDEAFRFFREDPQRAWELNFRKLQLFFYEWEIPNDSDLTSMAALYAPWMLRLPVTSGAILAFGLIGFVIALWDFKRTLPLTSFVVLYTASVVAFFVCSRFRVPMMPVAMVLAALVPVKACEYLYKRDFRGIIGLGIFSYFAWICIHRGIPQEVLDVHAANTQIRIGHQLSIKGLPGEAEHYEAALKLDSNCAEAESGLGYYHMRKGDATTAVRHFERALRLNGDLDVYEPLAGLQASLGRWDDAISTVQRGVDRLPGFLDLKRKLAFMLATCPIDRLRNGSEAVRLAEEVASVGLEIPQTYDTLAVAYAEVGRFDDAVRSAKKALDLARKFVNPEAIEQIGARLKLFEERKAFRQSIGVGSP
ncbi:MAG: glycosyltransferase family 39 protein [Phycisphaerae bacterium]|nr:glycosyltransferase family 39 protein [Phycisphaerae bacterium]